MADTRNNQGQEARRKKEEREERERIKKQKQEEAKAQKKLKAQNAVKTDSSPQNELTEILSDTGKKTGQNIEQAPIPAGEMVSADEFKGVIENKVSDAGKTIGAEVAAVTTEIPAPEAAKEDEVSAAAIEKNAEELSSLATSMTEEITKIADQAIAGGSPQPAAAENAATIKPSESTEKSDAEKKLASLKEKFHKAFFSLIKQANSANRKINSGDEARFNSFDKLINDQIAASFRTQLEGSDSEQELLNATKRDFDRIEAVIDDLHKDKPKEIAAEPAETIAPEPANTAEEVKPVIASETERANPEATPPENLPLGEKEMAALLKQWEKNRKAHYRDLLAKKQLGFDQEYAKRGKKRDIDGEIEAAMAAWDLKHPRPRVGLADTSTASTDFESMMAEAAADKTATEAMQPEAAPATSSHLDEAEDLLRRLEESEKNAQGAESAQTPETIPTTETKTVPPEETETPLLTEEEMEAILAGAMAPETPPPLPPETGEHGEPNEPTAEPTPEQAAPEARRNKVLRNIANQGILRERLREEAEATAGRELTDDEKNEINRLADEQAKFVKADKVKEMLIKDNDRVKKIFKPEGPKLSQERLKQEILTTLFDKKSLASQKKLKLLARQISEQSGLDMAQAEEVINQQEQRLRDEALAEINAGRVGGATGEVAAENASARKKRQLAWTIGKSAAYIGGGVLLGAVTGGVGAVAALTGVRIMDRLITDRLQKRQVDAKFAEMKAHLESDKDSRDAFLDRFFAETAAAQQQRISGENNFDFEGFAEANPDLLAGYEGEDREQVMRALGAMQEIDRINYVRENDLLERMADKLKRQKTVGQGYGLIEKTAIGFNKFFMKGGENTYERAVSAAMLGGAAIAAREMPIIRNVLLAMAGWKAGDFAGRKIWGDAKPEAGVIDDTDRAQDILDTLDMMRKNKTSDKHKKLAMKAGGAILAGLSPAIFSWMLDFSQGGGEVSPAPGGAGETMAAAAAEKSSANPFTEAVKEMEGVHGKDAPHLWGLIDRKVDAMTDNLSGIDEVKDMAGSEGRMTHIIDNIKDQVAKDPESFGLKPGANIDVLTAADLEKISQNDHFNELVAGMFDQNSFADQAMELTDKSIANIEANNDYNAEVVSHLPKTAHLGQAEYDRISELMHQGRSAGEAAEIMARETGSVSATVNPIEAAANATPAVGLEAVRLDSAVDFQDSVTRNNWHEVIDSIKSENKNLTAKSLDAIFRRTGLAGNYDATGFPYFKVENIAYGGGKVSFEIPTPASDIEPVSAIRFDFNPGKNELTATAGTLTEKIKDIKNIDDALKTAYGNIARQL